MWNVCAVIPAAGKGTRLGLDQPKLIAPVTKDETIWSIIRSKLQPSVQHVCVVMSPWGAPAFQSVLSGEDNDFVSTAIQPVPLGMGDAIFCGFSIWREAHQIAVIWGDQVNLSAETLRASLEQHRGRERTVVVPVTKLDQPYVEYRFKDGQLASVLESREGHVCAATGYSDVGVFVLSVAELEQAWREYLALGRRGSVTGELNFLPFLTYLAESGWIVEPMLVSDSDEARGVNTPDDLEFAALRFANSRHESSCKL